MPRITGSTICMKTILTILLFISLGANAQYVHVSPDTASRMAPDTVSISASICQCGAVITSGVWSQTLGPAVTIPLPKANINKITFKTAGLYAFAFNVTDLSGKKYADTLQVLIRPAPRTIKSMTINYLDGTSVLTKGIQSVTVKYSDGTSELKTVIP